MSHFLAFCFRGQMQTMHSGLTFAGDASQTTTFEKLNLDVVMIRLSSHHNIGHHELYTFEYPES